MRYRQRRRQEDGSIKLSRRSKRLGSMQDYPTKSEIEPVRMAFMQKVNSGQLVADECMTLAEFVEAVYLAWAQIELRASTQKGYGEIWENHMSGRVGQIRLREFRTVHASRMLRAEHAAGSGDSKLAMILDAYGASMHHPSTGVMFHHGNGERMDMDKLAQRVIRSAVEAIGLQWHGWHGFRRGIASNLYALGQ